MKSKKATIVMSEQLVQLAHFQLKKGKVKAGLVNNKGGAKIKVLLWTLLVVVLMAATAVGAYFGGYSNGVKNAKAANAAPKPIESDATVNSDATVMSPDGSIINIKSAEDAYAAGKLWGEAVAKGEAQKGTVESMLANAEGLNSALADYFWQGYGEGLKTKTATEDTGNENNENPASGEQGDSYESKVVDDATLQTSYTIEKDGVTLVYEGATLVGAYVNINGDQVAVPLKDGVCDPALVASTISAVVGTEVSPENEALSAMVGLVNDVIEEASEDSYETSADDAETGTVFQNPERR